MAIAFDNSAAQIALNPGTSSWSYTCAANATLIVFGHHNLTAATYNGVNLISLISYTPSIVDGNQQTIKAFYLPRAASGANTLSVTIGAGTNEMILIASYTGMDNVIQPEASNTQFSNNGVNNTQVTSLATSLSTLTNNAWTILLAATDAGTKTVTAGTGTLRTTNMVSILTAGGAIIDSNGPISPAGLSTLQANMSSGTGFMSLAILSFTVEGTSSTGSSFFGFF